MSPVVSASRRPTGYSRVAAPGTRSTTVGRPWVSCAVETTPAGLGTGETTRRGGPPSASPSTAIRSVPVTARAGSVTVAPSTVTRPAAIIASAARRDATPAWARGLARRIVPAKLPCSAMDLALLDDRLTALGEPRFRAKQVWAWTARGAGGYE